METTKNRPLGPARIVALALIALTVSALAFVRFAPGAGRVSVPSGAHAGNLILKPCSYSTEDGSYRADCGTLVVPENRADPRSRLIALPVTRIRALSAHPGTAIFRLEGGPGITNMQFSKASRLADRHDVVLVGYRGVDGSSRLDCPEVVSALKHSADFLGTKSERAYSDAFRSCANRLRADGVDLAGYTLPQRVDDLEAARRALGYRRIDLVSESAGTRTAMIYSWRYPKSIQRSVMIGVNPPGHFVYDPKTTDAQIRHYSELCAQDDSCSKRTDDLAASMRRTAADIPDRWGFLPIKQGNVRLASFFGLMESTSEAAPISAPMTLNSWLSAAKGDPSGFWFMSLMADLAFPDSFVWGDLAATGIQDAPAADAYYSAGGDRGSILGNPATEFVWAGGGLIDAWPHNPADDQYRRVRTTKVETLLIGGTVDFSTPARNATRDLLPHLPNGHQVVLAEFGHATDFWTYQPEASTRLLNTFFDSGKVDDSIYKHQTVDFTPEMTQAAIAKIIAGTMVALAILAVLSLLWMARRVRKRGSFGRKASASLRSLYPLVLGLGGWFFGAMLVMTTLPGTPLDSEVLAGLSVGMPVGLGIYWAWVHREWSATTRTVGFAAAVGGALVGGWLGFNATTGMLALVTTIVGAAVGGNLTLLALDIAWDRSVRDRVADPTAVPALASAGV
jgi:pimeloyl-ACP methyl ester carboxylesterase